MDQQAGAGSLLVLPGPVPPPVRSPGGAGPGRALSAAAGRVRGGLPPLRRRGVRLRPGAPGGRLTMRWFMSYVVAYRVPPPPKNGTLPACPGQEHDAAEVYDPVANVGHGHLVYEGE